MSRRILQILSALALLGTLLPPILHLAGSMDLPTVKGWMLASTLLWFATVPFWMDKQSPE